MRLSRPAPDPRRGEYSRDDLITGAIAAYLLSGVLLGCWLGKANLFLLPFVLPVHLVVFVKGALLGGWLASGLRGVARHWQFAAFAALGAGVVSWPWLPILVAEAGISIVRQQHQYIPFGLLLLPVIGGVSALFGRWFAEWAAVLAVRRQERPERG